MDSIMCFKLNIKGSRWKVSPDQIVSPVNEHLFYKREECLSEWLWIVKASSSVLVQRVLKPNKFEEAFFIWSWPTLSHKWLAKKHLDGIDCFGVLEFKIMSPIIDLYAKSQPPRALSWPKTNDSLLLLLTGFDHTNMSYLGTNVWYLTLTAARNRALSKENIPYRTASIYHLHCLDHWKMSPKFFDSNWMTLF